MIKIAVSGTHGTGKTTHCKRLIDELRTNGQVCFISEMARLCPFPINQDTTEQSQLWIFTAQINAELTAESTSPDYLICDRSILDNIAYSVVMGLPWRYQLALANQYMLTYNRIYLHLPENNQWQVEDGVRDMDKKFRMDVARVLAKLYGDLQNNCPNLEIIYC